MRTTYRALIVALLLVLLLLVGCGPATRLEIPDDGSVVRMVYFYSEDCSHCQSVEQNVLGPLQTDFGSRLEIRWIDIYAEDSPENYELLIRAEEYFGVPPEERGLPTLVIDGQVLIGEEQITQDLACLLDSCFVAGGTTWPDVPGWEAVPEGVAEAPDDPAPDSNPFVLPVEPGAGPGEVVACEEEATTCEEPVPIWAAYFYQPGCQDCSRAEADIRYVRGRHQQLIIDEFNFNDNAALAHWLLKDTGREWESFHAPAIFIGTDVLVGEEEITPQNLEALLQEYAPTGADRTWDDFDPESETEEIVDWLPGVFTVVLAGLVDGLNPCAFATLIFLIAYLAAGERKGRDILIVGGLFAFGVFLAYLMAGLGLHRILDGLLGAHLATLGRWVSGLTAIFCLVLAVYSLLDFRKARRGRIEDMSLSLPGFLRTRVRAVIREGQKARAYFAAAFVTGVVVSLLELACTGQVYLPTIIFVATVPGMRPLATAYLVLYNLVFILPLVVVFALTYFGTTSAQMGLFLKRHTAAIKLGTAVLFSALAVWLGLSVLHGSGLL